MTDHKDFKNFLFFEPNDIEDILKIQGNLFVSPATIRQEIISGTTNLADLSRIATLITLFGVNPNKSRGRILRTQANIDIKSKAIKLLDELVVRLSNLKANSIVRGTQFQAAFPDLILASRQFLISKNWVPQRFVEEDVLPLEFQFGGSGPIIPDALFQGYRDFCEEFTEKISQGKSTVNKEIMEQSLRWRLKQVSRTVARPDMLTSIEGKSGIYTKAGSRFGFDRTSAPSAHDDPVGHAQYASERKVKSKNGLLKSREDRLKVEVTTNLDNTEINLLDFDDEESEEEEEEKTPKTKKKSKKTTKEDLAETLLKLELKKEEEEALKLNKAKIEILNAYKESLTKESLVKPASFSPDKWKKLTDEDKKKILISAKATSLGLSLT
jgi:hypothetical protein